MIIDKPFDSRILDEITIVQARGLHEPKTVDRSKKVSSYLVGLNDEGYLLFKSPGVTTKGAVWTQKILLEDFLFLSELDEPSLTNQEKAQLSIWGNIKMSCDCPAQLYWGYAYILTTRDSIIPPRENRRPDIRNPQLRGVCCKHLVNVLRVLPASIFRVASFF